MNKIEKVKLLLLKELDDVGCKTCRWSTCSIGCDSVWGLSDSFAEKLAKSIVELYREDRSDTIPAPLLSAENAELGEAFCAGLEKGIAQGLADARPTAEESWKMTTERWGDALSELAK